MFSTNMLQTIVISIKHSDTTISALGLQIMANMVKFMANSRSDLPDLGIEIKFICQLFEKTVPNDRLKAIMAAGLLA